MPEIPRIFPQAEARPSNMPRAPVHDYAYRGGPDIGKALSSVGNLFATLADKRKDLNNATEFSQAQADIMTGAERIRQEIGDDPDTEGHEARWVKEYNQLLTKSLEKRNPEVRNAINNWGMVYGANQQIKVMASSYEIAREQQIVAVNDLTKQYILIATDPGRLPEEQLQAQEDFRKQLQIRTEIFTPIEIQKRLDMFEREVDTANAYSMLIEGREVDWNRYPGVYPTEREQLIEKAMRFQSVQSSFHNTEQKRLYEDNIISLISQAQQGRISNEDMESLKGFVERKDFEEIQKNRELAAAGITDPFVHRQTLNSINTGEIRSEADIWNNDNLSINDKQSLVAELNKKLELRNKPNYQVERHSLDKQLIEKLQLKEYDEPWKTKSYYDSHDKFNQLVGNGMDTYKAKLQVLNELQQELDDIPKRQEALEKENRELARKILFLTERDTIYLEPLKEEEKEQ